MSVDFVGETTPVLDVPVLLYLGEVIVADAEGVSLAETLAQVNAAPDESGPILHDDSDDQEISVDENTTLIQAAAQSLELLINTGPTGGNSASVIGEGVVELDDGAGPYFTFEPNMPSDEGGGGHIDVYEPVINVPEGFAPEHHYATEFILDVNTGIFTIHLYFSTDPLDYQTVPSASLVSSVDGVDQQGIDLGFGVVSPLNAGTGSKCTVTITKTTTQTSGTSSFSFKSGVVNYTSNSGGSSVTTTRSYSYEGHLKNGRCVATNAR